jgi:hypothetical protein
MADLKPYDREALYQEQYKRFTQMKMPRCPLCGSGSTQSVQIGIIQVTIRLAATCPNFKLLPNGPKLGDWYCQGCKKYFDIPKDDTGQPSE